jgi:F0F1-type ATP synthase gamma subunit
MENAIRRLDKDSTRLKLEANALREEEITEEIEVILRPAEALADEEQV